MTINEGKLLIEQKVEDFNKNEKQYLSKTFQETEVRTRFIDPFFQALGWDFNQTNISKHLWDVHREYSQKDNSNTKKPDYAFNISGKLKFFVEAKAPWVLLTDKVPVFQAKRYAYSTNGKAPVVIITDFQEFRVFNAIERPIFDNPLQGLIKELDLKYNNYLTKWDLIYGNFSKEAVMSGSIDKLIGKITKETKTLDKEFLSDLIIFRELLAKNIAIRNKELSVDIINECVQRILDRIIFIRNIEDRDIENEILFKISESKDNVYKSLLPVFSKLNDDYNGLLFKPDISDKVIIDDDIIRKIIKNLYPPHSPFQFDIIEPEILGRIYEKFLGSKIRLTESHQAKVEEKPEVRHAGGVFYTPQFIVENIVFNTVGKILTENKMTPEDVEKIKILDPACGSGSFLLGAFDYLIKYHENWYRNNKSSRKYKDDFFETQEGEIRLSVKKKSDILKNNLFGADIDREATEVAIMSLYLKLLDQGFDKGQGLLFLRGHILPEMSRNIKCGNSLINREQLLQFDLFGDESINPFDWEKEFPFKFDVIIGNPPYIKTQELQKFNPKATDVYKKIYKSASSGNFDIYILFIEKAISLLSEKGLIGYILPHTFFNANFGQNIRKIISDLKNIYKIIHFGSNFIFDNPATTCLLFLTKAKTKNFDYYQVRKIKEKIDGEYLKSIKFYNVDSEKITENNWIFLSKEEDFFFNKIKGNNPLLEEITTNIFQGPKAGADPVFIIKMLDFNKRKCKCYSNSLNKEFFIEHDIIKPYVKGKRIKRYFIIRNEEYIIYPYTLDGILITEKELKNKYPLTYQYLSENENKKILLDREEGRFKKIWWSYSRPQNMKILDKFKILTPFNAYENSFCYDFEGDFIFSAGVSGAYGILLKEELNISYYYLLGILNSSTIEKYLRFISIDINKGYFSYENKYIKQLPIYIPNPNDKVKFEKCKKIEEFVKQILEFKKQGKDKDANFLEGKIDELVEEIYGVKI